MTAPSADREVVLVSHGELGSGAWEAHVLGLARALSPHERVRLVALASPRLWLSGEGRRTLAAALRRAEDILPGSVRVVPHAPRRAAFAADAWSLARALREVCEGSTPLVLHARGYLAVLTAHGARRGAFPEAAIVHDVRGDRAAEVAASGGEFEPDEVLRLEREACRVADAHAAVSSRLAEHLAQVHGVEHAAVFPCAVDTDRFRPDEAARAATRRELAVGEAPLLGFSGGLAGWQRPEALARCFGVVRELSPGARLLVLTPDVLAYRAVLAAGLSSADLAATDVRRVPHDEVPTWLAGCDLTALLRDRDAVNAVASPIKFGESLACGVPVVVTEGLGDVSSLVRERNVGVVLDDALLAGDSDRTRVAALLGAVRGERELIAARCRHAAEEAWSWREQVPRWLALHASLAGQR